MDKLKQVTIGEKADKVKTLTAEEREAKIAYLRNLFRLSFRVPDEDENESEKVVQHEAEETMDYDEDVNDDFYYDNNQIATDDHDDTVNWGGFDEEEANDFRESFAALDAVDVFYQLCIDYCEDQLAVLQKRLVKHQQNLEAHIKSMPDASLQISKHIREENQYLLEFYTERVNNNQQLQKEFTARLATMKQQLAELTKTSQPNNQKKSTNIIAAQQKTAPKVKAKAAPEVTPTIG